MFENNNNCYSLFILFFVFFCRGLYRGRHVAVKKFSPNNITFDRAEVVREAALMSILDHPNLVEYIGSCLNPRNMFIVIDLYPTK